MQEVEFLKTLFLLFTLWETLRHLLAFNDSGKSKRLFSHFKYLKV